MSESNFDVVIEIVKIVLDLNDFYDNFNKYIFMQL